MAFQISTPSASVALRSGFDAMRLLELLSRHAAEPACVVIVPGDGLDSPVAFPASGNDEFATTEHRNGHAVTGPVVSWREVNGGSILDVTYRLDGVGEIHGREVAQRMADKDISEEAAKAELFHELLG